MLDNTSINIRDIVLWKRKYGSIFYIKINDNEYIYRPLTKGEFSDMLSLSEKIDIGYDDIVLELCLLYPHRNSYLLDTRLAGEVDHVINCINQSSGFSRVDQLELDIDKARSAIEVLDNQIVSLICKAFPRLTLDDIDKFNYDTLLHHLALAESMLGIKLKIEKNVNQIDFDNPEAQDVSTRHVGPHNKKQQRR